MLKAGDVAQPKGCSACFVPRPQNQYRKLNRPTKGAHIIVARNSKKAWMKLPDDRHEMPEYPERAVLESCVNALIHRDYLDYGSEVHIDMFDDRLEIYSPGGMMDGTMVQNLDVLSSPT